MVFNEPFFVIFTMVKSTLKKSDRKFIRLEKARIRREFLDPKKQEELIGQIYKKFFPNAAVLETGSKSAEMKKNAEKPAAHKTGKKAVRAPKLASQKTDKKKAHKK